MGPVPRAPAHPRRGAGDVKAEHKVIAAASTILAVATVAERRSK
jgi:hypothetical protein